MAELEELKSKNTCDKGEEEISSCAFSRTDEKYERGEWANRVEFLLSLLGLTIGLGSIWRFPILCMRNGGGAFLVPFFFFMVVYGAPLYYLEVYLGQFTGRSPGSAFELCPLLKGVGWSMVTLSFICTWYYNLILAWILYFLVHSFFPVLPWTTCDNWWNTQQCRVPRYQTDGMSTPSRMHVNNSDTSRSLNTTYSITVTPNITYSTPANEFWTNNVLRKSSSLEDYGAVQWHLVLALLASWVLMYLCLIRGVRSIGKVVYVTATLPFVLLTVMFVRGLTLDGAIDGIVLYLTPDFKKLATLQVWIEAAIQVFYSLTPCWGCVINMASFNKFRKRPFWDVTITVCCDGFTAFYSGLIVFTLLGFMAKESGLSVKEVAQAQGFGLIFVAYPEAISRLPLPQLWAVLFFTTLVTIGLDSQFGLLEGVISSIIDALPTKTGQYKSSITAVIITVMFILDLPFATNGAMYLFQLIDWYQSAFGLFVNAGIEILIVSWIYGADRFSRDVHMMTGKHITVFMRLMWCYVVPGFVMVFFLLTAINFKIPDYGDGYVYQDYAITIGYIVAVLPVIPIIVLMIKELVTAKGSIIKRFNTTLQPSKTWKPNDVHVAELYAMEPYAYETTFCLRRKADLFGSKLNEGT